MRVHHLNCGTDCPLGGALIDGSSPGLHARLVCHCLLLETEAGLVLVDTGYGLNDVRTPYPRLSRTFGSLLNVKFREQETAIRQIQALGFKPTDVRHILLTHLDFDHAGGIQDFPHAEIHVMAAELHNARIMRRGFIANRRYRSMQFANVRNWQRYRINGDTWFGFHAVQTLNGLPPEILMIPLKGHTWGHAGIAIDMGEEGWLLHAGDAYFHHRELDEFDPECPVGLRLYQDMMEVDRRSRLLNQERLRKLAHDETAQVRIICAHDAAEFDHCVALNREAELKRKLNRLETASMQITGAEAL